MKSKEILNDLTTSLPVVMQKSGNAEERFRGRFLGQVAENLILVQTEDGVELEENQKLVIRMVQEGRAIGFETTLVSVVQTPVRLFFLSLPDNVEIVSLRKAERMDVFVPVDVRLKGSGADKADTRIIQGYMTNISSGGCRVLAKSPVKAESVVYLSFNLPLEKHLYTLSGTVIENTAPKGEQKAVFGHRIRFFPAETNVQDMGEIRRWINQNLDFTDLFS